MYSYCSDLAKANSASHLIANNSRVGAGNKGKPFMDSRRRY